MFIFQLNSFFIDITLPSTSALIILIKHYREKFWHLVLPMQLLIHSWIILIYLIHHELTLEIIIMPYHGHGYPWPFLATSPYRFLLLAGPQGYTPYPHRATVCRFKLVILLSLGYVKGSIGVHHLWACPYFSSSVLHVWFILFG